MLLEMAEADVDHKPVAVVEVSNIPQINVQGDSPDLTRSTSFQPALGYSSHEGSSTPTIDDFNGIESAQGHQTKKPQFVARDGAIGGNYNETNVE